jgi:hypothetical protein
MRVMQDRNCTTRPVATESSIDLTAQEPLDPPSEAGMVEVTDIYEVDPLLRTGSFAANSVAPDISGDSVEIELTAEQMEAMLDGNSR